MPPPEEHHKILKAGPHLCHQSLPFTDKVYSLANNHMMDYGEFGLNNTLQHLQRLDIPHAGCDLSLDSALQPVIVNEAGKSIAIISCCERQFGIAGNTTPGCAAFGPWVFSLVARLRQEVDYIIVSFHQALEMSPLPSPRAQQLYRALVDCGVNIVHGHHAHVPQAYEEYNHGLIFYGLGNAVVDPEKWKEAGQNTLWSLRVEIKFSPSLQYEIRFIRINDSSSGATVEYSNLDCELLMEHMQSLNAIVHDVSLLVYILLSFFTSSMETG